MLTETIILASDHAGHHLKEQVKDYLAEFHSNFTVLDVKPELEERDAYPEIMRKGAIQVLQKEGRGIFFGGSGNGEAMAANKVPGIRAALCYNVETARLGRAHNNANVLVIGARFSAEHLTEQMVKTFIETPFDGGRHQDRIDDLDITSL
jgi:ribose 5-phosphate isomerase B